jgi:Na+-driven multidrug efflux pump
MSGYLRGYGISLTPAIVTMITICGTRVIWVMTVFAHYKSFMNLMAVYPLSLGLNAVFIFLLVLIRRPAKKLGGKLNKVNEN